MVRAQNDDVVRTQVEFEILEELAQEEGANADTFVVRDIQTDEVRAAKRIDASKFQDYQDYFEEARQMTDAGHPNVVPVYFCGVEVADSNGQEDSVWVLMDYYEGGSLQGLHESRQLTVQEIVEVGLQVLTGLSYVHGQEILHLDLKPSNILFRNDGIAAITDFGLSKWVDDYGAADQSRFYMPYLMPEAIGNRRQTVQTDLYQLGLTLYRLCNTPESWQSQLHQALGNLHGAIMAESFPARQTFLPHIPERLRRVIRRALEIDPDDRFGSAREMMNELAKVQKYLHWQMHRAGSETGHFDWVRKGKERTWRCQILENGNNFAVKTKKTKNQPRRIRDACKDGFEEFEDAMTFVKTSIRSHID